MGPAGPGQRPDPSPCSLQPSEDPEVGLDSPMNHMLLGSAGSGLGVLQLLRYPRSAAGFTAQGKMVGLTGERLRPPPLSASRGRGGGRACTAHRACPPSSPSRGWSYTRGSQLGGHLRQGQRTTATRTPSPGGPQVHTLLSSRGPAWGSRDHMSPVWRNAQKAPGRGAWTVWGRNGPL